MVFGLGAAPRPPVPPAGSGPESLKVLVCCDGSEHSVRAVDLAAALLSPAVTVRLLTVASKGFDKYEGPWGPLSDEEERDKELKSFVDRAFGVPTERLQKAGIQPETMVLLGNPAEQILDHVHEWQPDMVVVGRYGTTGLRKMMMGSVSDTLVKSAGVPVLVVP